MVRGMVFRLGCLEDHKASWVRMESPYKLLAKYKIRISQQVIVVETNYQHLVQVDDGRCHYQLPLGSTQSP